MNHDQSDFDDAIAASGHNQVLLAAKLREAREYIGFKLHHVARNLGVSTRDISAMENGVRPISKAELKKFAHLYQKELRFFNHDDHLAKNHATLKENKISRISQSDQQGLSCFAEFLQEVNKSQEKSIKGYET